MVPAVGHRPLIAETRVSSSGICGGQSGTGTGCSQSFHCHYHSTMAVNTHISTGVRTIDPIVVALQRHFLTPST
jgi:hypothetical protein